MASNIKFDFKDIKPDIDTVRDLAYKSDYNFEQIISALNLFSYRGVEIGPEEPEDKDCLWIDTSDETVEETAQNVSILQDIMTAISELQDRMTSIEQAIASGGGIPGGDSDITDEYMVMEDGTPLVTELGVPFILEN